MAMRGGGEQALRGPEQIAALPGQERAERHRQQQRHHQRAEGEVEVGRADRDLGAGERLEHQRIERAEEHGGAGRRSAARC